MIASLRGTVEHIALDSAVIECAGVGYLVYAAPPMLASLRRGEEAFVYTTMIVREDAMTLYGFPNPEARELFALLQTVNGVGPRLALAAQAVFNPDEIAQAIAQGETKALQRIPGVGKRTADRMIVDLKDKVKAFISEDPESPSLTVEGATAVDGRAPQLVEALIGLGFSEKQAAPAVASVLAEEPELDTPAALRAALRLLGKK